MIFVRHGIPGEKVRVRLTDAGETAKFWRADVVEVLDASPDRVEHFWRAADSLPGLAARAPAGGRGRIRPHLPGPPARTQVGGTGRTAQRLAGVERVPDGRTQETWWRPWRRTSGAEAGPGRTQRTTPARASGGGRAPASRSPPAENLACTRTVRTTSSLSGRCRSPSEAHQRAAAVGHRPAGHRTRGGGGAVERFTPPGAAGTGARNQAQAAQRHRGPASGRRFRGHVRPRSPGTSRSCGAGPGSRSRQPATTTG